MARWGIALQAVGYWLIYIPSRPVFSQPLAGWRIAAGTLCGLAGIGTAAAAIRHLGKQWRVDASLNADHELVRTGPYRIIRHPIYASMLALLAMSIFFAGRLPWWPFALAIFVAGIEIRVRAEDELLHNRFGKAFDDWKRRVPAYLPRVR